jgi:hypothetical protein
MYQRLLSEISASLEDAHQSLSVVVIALNHVHAATSDDVKLFATIALHKKKGGLVTHEIQAGRTCRMMVEPEGKYSRLSKSDILLSTINGRSLSTGTDCRNLTFSSRSRRPQLIIIFWKTLRSNENTLQCVKAAVCVG